MTATSALAILYCPFPDAATARNAANTLLTERLVACCNLLPSSEALYWWEGAITQGTETILLAKTTAEKAAAALARLATLHPYECPAILQFSANANAPFAAWVTAETGNLTKS